MIIVGIALEILAAGVGTTSKQLIAYSSHVGKPWIFHIGATMNVALGPIIDASAYAFAPQVVVAPFASLDVIFNALTAPYTLRWQEEELTRVHILACVLVAAGAAFTSVLGSVHDETLTVEEVEAQLTKVPSFLYLAIEAGVIIALILCHKQRRFSSRMQGVVLGVVAGILVGNVFCIKCFINIVRSSIVMDDYHAFLRPTPYLLISAAAATSLGGHVFMKRGLGRYKGVFMITIFEGAHITTACLSGDIVMAEMRDAGWWRYVLYWASVWLIIGGVLIINTLAEKSQLRRPMASDPSLPLDGFSGPALDEPCGLERGDSETPEP